MGQVNSTYIYTAPTEAANARRRSVNSSTSTLTPPAHFSPPPITRARWVKKAVDAARCTKSSSPRLVVLPVVEVAGGGDFPNVLKITSDFIILLPS